MKMPIMDQLHQDHKNYSKLLDMMESYVQEQKKGSDKGYREMYLIMNYMTRYPDMFHHRYEDIIFGQLTEIDDGHGHIIKDLLDEHNELAEVSNILIEELNAANSGHIIKKAKIQDAAQRYSALLRSHMNIEEGQVFPLINERMTDANWKKIEGQIKHVKDPIFGDVVSDEFKLLYNHIFESRP